jgi:alpha-beta hydrolase superfamily lysophospholipase
MDRRIILLPGFGEDRRIFRTIMPYFENYNTLIIDYQDLLPNFTIYNIRLEKFVKKLIRTYRITSNDILIGHSMGGYLAHYIRQRVGCEVCLHSSFTNPKKIKVIVHNKSLMGLTIKNGLTNTILFKAITRWKYKDKPSKEEIEHIMALLHDYGSHDVWKMMLLFFKRKTRFMNWLRSTPEYDLAPSLIIHPEGDKVVAAPDLEYESVPGDHFSIVTYPELTFNILENWLKNMDGRVVQLHSNYKETALQEAI